MRATKQERIIEGEKLEDYFMEKVAPYIGISVVRNPARDIKHYKLDFLIDGKEAELKCTNIPFFKLSMENGIDPAYLVKLGDYQYRYYKSLYPLDFDIYYWANRINDYKRYEHTCARISGVWKIPFSQLVGKVIRGECYRFAYTKEDDINQKSDSKEPYFFNVLDKEFECLALFEYIGKR